MNLNLSGAYRLNEGTNFDTRHDAVYARAKIGRFAGDLGQLVAAQNPALAPVANRIQRHQIAHLNGKSVGLWLEMPVSLYELDKKPPLRADLPLESN